MANETTLLINGTQLMFRDVTDFPTAGAGPPTTAANSIIIGTPTGVQMDLTSLAASGGSRESTKTADLGAARAPWYRVDACLEHAATPVDGETVDFYWGGSPSATAATGNPGSLTGTDADVTETDGLLGQLQYVGSLILRAATINIGHVGIIIPDHRYGILVIENNSTASMHTAMDETHITMTPMTHGPAA